MISTLGVSYKRISWDFYRGHSSLDSAFPQYNFTLIIKNGTCNNISSYLIHFILTFLQKRKLTTNDKELDEKEDHESLEFKDQDHEMTT